VQTIAIEKACQLVVDCPHSTPEWTEAGVVVFRSNNVRNGRLDLSARSFTTEANYQARVRRAEPRQGDLIITREAPMGEVAMIPPGVRGCLGQRMVLLRPNSTLVDGRFLLYALLSPRVQAEIQTHEGTGSTVSNLRIPALEALQIPFPPLHEQRAIAGVLGALDDKIELNRRMNETLEAMARALFKSWFVDFDPVHAKAEGRAPFGMDAATAKLFPDSFEESDLGLTPKGWTPSTIGEHVSLVRGTTYSGKLVGLPGPALLGLGSIVEGGGFRDGRYKTYGGECPEKLMLVPGDMYVALKGATKDGSMVGSVARVPPSVPFGRLTQDTVKLELITARPGLASTIYRLLLEPTYRCYCAARITGSAQVGFSREDFLSYGFPLPDDASLAAFGEIESSIAYRQYAANAESKTLAELRDALLPRLLSGELRVRDAEKLLEDHL
jgi:type I restriction enzyme, S subunit